MANVSDILNQRVQALDLLPTNDVQSASDGNPYTNNPNYVAPAVDPNDQGEVYNGPAAPWTPPAVPTPAQNKMSSLSDKSANKMAGVAATADAKKVSMTPAQYFNNAVGANTGKGRDSATQVELDLRDLSPTQIYQKYGEQEGNRLLGGQAQGERQLLQADTRGARTGTELWDDFNVNFGQGLGAALGGVGGLAAGIVSDDLGTGAASLLGDFNKFMDSSQSDRLQTRKSVQEAKEALDNRDTTAQQVKDTETDGKLIAGLKKVGRDVINTLGNATDDSATFGSGVSNALGSFVAAGPVAKGLSAVSKGVLGTTAAIAATEAGGSYSQVTDDVLKRDHATLMQESPMYRELIASGESEDDARKAVANRTGLISAAVTAPFAAAAGRLVHKFEGNPLGLGAGRQLAGNVARETVEETAQSGFGQFAQNLAESQVANTNKDLTEGVGRATAEGGLYGFGMSTALGIPNIAKSTAGTVGSTVAKAFNDRVAGIDEANKKSSPIADEVVSQAAAEAQASAPAAEAILRNAVETADVTPEQKVEANNYVDSLLSASRYDAAEAPPQFAGSMGDVTNRVGAIQRMAEIVNGLEEGSNDQLRAGFYLNELVQEYSSAINTDPEALSALPADNQAAQIVAQYQNLMGVVGNTPKVMAAIDTVMQMLEKSAPKVVDVTPETLATPEGVQDVNDVLATAELAPEKVDLATGEKILYQIEQGNLDVTPRQKAALDSSVALLRAVQEADKAAVASGKADPVSLNVSSVDGEKGKSLTQHAKGIMSAWKSGDRDLAADRLADLKNFAQGMSNKVGALNTHLASGNPNAARVGYKVFVGGKPVDSASSVGVRPGNQNSVEFAQKVGREAKLLADVYNGLVSAFPDLEAKHLAVTPLSKELSGSAAEVVARNQPQAAPVVKVEDTTPAPQAAPTPVKESAPVATPTVAEPKVKAPETKVAESVVEEALVIADRNGYVQSIAKKVTDLPDGTKLYEPGTDTTVTVQHVVSPNSGLKQTDVIGDNGKVRFSLVENKDGSWREQGTAFLDQDIEAVAAPALKGTAAVFPKLINGAANFFNKAFKIPTTQRARTLGIETPVSTIRSALADSAALTSFIGSPLKGKYTPEVAKAYKSYLAYSEDLASELDDNLQAYLDTPYSKSEKRTRRELIESDAEIKLANGGTLKGSEFARTLEGKPLNITEQDGDTLAYNPELIQGVVLAGLQWFINSEQYGTVQDTKDISDLLGMSEASVSDSIVQSLNEGMSATEAARTLARKIRNYWGVQNENSAPRGYTEGIPEAMAKEMLRVFVKGGWLTETTVKLTEADGLPALPDGKPNVQTFIRLTPAKLPEDSPIREFPSAIEQAVLVEPEETSFIGEGNLPPVAKDQLRNPGVKNTAQQLEAIKNEQSTPYYVNTVMAGFYTALGKDNILKLFGAGEVDPTKMNVNHAQSMEGVNRSTVAAYDHLVGLLGQIQNNGPIDQTPVHYAFNMTRVARLQMLGKYNPQSNKLVREAVLPTYSTLDLSSATGVEHKQFMLGVAQAMGEKVHKMSQARSRAKAEALLTGPLAPLVQELARWSNTHKAADVLNPDSMIDSSIVDMMVDGFNAAGVGMTPMALHAVMEYSRLQGTEDKSAFRTAIYVEADGVTNGPINAMVLFTTGLFKGTWLQNIAKGGLFFNRPGETVNTNNEFVDDQDLYQATTNVLDKNLAALRKELAGDDAGTEQMNAMLRLMDEFYEGDLKYIEDSEGKGTLELKRGIAKNPLTITIYGSGASGIAAKMTKMLTDAIYERMSQVAEARAAGEKSLAVAMFGPQSSSRADADARFARFVDSYTKLTTVKAGLNKEGVLTFKPTRNAPKATSLDPVTFTLEVGQIKNMQSNLRYLFVDPMRDAISTTVGQELLDTAEMLRMATQAQSIVLEHAFKAEVQATLAEKAKDPEWKETDGLSQQDEDNIRKKLDHLTPLINTDHQSFYVAGSETSDIEQANFSRALDGKFRTPAFTSGPKDAGVSGIPFLNIGSGDGQMMQTISTMKGTIKGTLKIFDGMNMPLDQMEKGAEQANQAVYESWVANPLAAVHETFTKFLADAQLKGLGKEANLALSKALFGLQSDAVSEGEIIAAMGELNAGLNTAQQSIAARHRVMERVSISIDQMAAVGVPFVKEGDLPLVGTDPISIAEQMNVYYLQELAEIQGTKAVTSLAPELAARGTKHETGVYVLNSDDIANLSTAFPANQAAVINEVVKSLAANDFTVVLGSILDVAKFNEATGREGLTEANLAEGLVSGYTNFPTKTIYMFNTSTETLAHELIHAATFSAVSAHYAGETTPVVKAAVGRLEVMMDQFLALGGELTATSDSLNSAYNNVSSVVKGYLANGDQAAALNEFMAWTLSNESLARIAKRTQVSKFARIKDGIIAAIKTLFGITQNVGKDMFSNLLFNTSIVMNAQPTLSQQFAQNALFQNSIYGDNDRLAAINESLKTTIGRYLNEPIKAGALDPQSSLLTGIQNGYRVAESFLGHGFNMNMQESSTFNTIVAALSTEAAIDPNAMSAVQQAYAHVMKNLSPESFMRNPEVNDPNDYKQAVDKFDVLSGKYLVTKDLSGRSSLLPAFLALATTNEEFRAVLAKMEMPKTEKNTAGSLDALLENMGNSAMDSLGRRMAGVKKPANVTQAIDMMNARIAQVINRRDNYIDTMASKAGGTLDRTNDVVVQGMDKLGQAALKFATRTQRNAAGRLERAAGGIAAGFASLINNDAAGAVSEATMTAINKTEMWNSVHRLINDLIGRTENNASIYDMIKAVRSMVQRTRQQYRENLPELLASKFTRELTKEESATMHRAMAKTDLSVLGKDALTLAVNPTAEIASLEQQLAGTQHWKLVQKKAKQLANYMNNGIPGKNLLRNADAVARLLNEGVKVNGMADVSKLDRLITLYAVEGLSQEDKDSIASLVQDQAEGMKFTMAYLQGQRAEEQRKATGNSKLNSIKGYAPTVGNEGVSMLVADDTEYSKLIGKSYQRVGDYVGSSVERIGSHGYYFIPVSAKATFEQGILQNVRQTSGGVDIATGHTTLQTAGRTTDAADVKQLLRLSARETSQFGLIPVFDDAGDVIAFERPLDPEMVAKTEGEQDLHKAIGIWRGRQVEEGFAQAFNEQLLDRLHEMYERDLARDPDNAKQYVDVLSTSDKVVADAAKLISYEMRAKIEGMFGDKLMVRKDMLDDVLGYRAASIGDAWTGNSRWSPKTLEAVRNVATSVFGNQAYKTMLTAEKTLQAVVSDAKVLIVVKSVIVPVANLMSNMFQLAARGVPVKNIVKDMASKTAEVETYTKSLVRRIAAEAELRASQDPRTERRLKTEIQSINDSHKRMSIWPLIEAGEFSGIADQGITRKEISLTSGRLQAYMEQAAQKLPGWGSTLGRYALVTKDTALFQGLQKAVEYGDFLAKAVLYDELTKRKGKTKAEALAIITEEYVNYDRLPGRFRGTLENNGLLWFYNFKIRSVKVALSMIRNNPVHTLLATVTPSPDMFGTVGLPTEDNMFAKLAQGTLDYSMGPSQGMHSMMLNPWINLTQ